MIDPDHFHEGDTPATTQLKRIALTLDIQTRYGALFREIHNRPMEDPTRERDHGTLVKRQKEEMDKLFAEAIEKPIVVPVEYDKGGHLIKHRSLSPDTFIFYMGTKASTCKRCGKVFIKSKTRRKYCSDGCMKLAKTDCHTQKRRERKT